MPKKEKREGPSRKKDKKLKRKASKKKDKSVKEFKCRTGGAIIADEEFYRVREECYEAVQAIIDEGEPYVDEDFPMYDKETALQSIFGDDPQHDSSLNGIRTTEWEVKRLTEVNPDGLDLVAFSDGASAHDITQGGIGTCFYLGALMCIAEHHKLVNKLLVNHSVELGVYGIMFFANCEWTYVIVDDYFPFQYGKDNYFSKSKDPSELWVTVFEKAYAKLHGAVDLVDGGHCSWALVDLTGGIPVKIDKNSWEELHEAVQSDLYCIGCGLDNVEGTDKDETEEGLIPGHVYSVLNTLEYDGVRLVNVRNPHGGGEWNGAYSDNSDLWTDELREAANHVNEDDGSFWMPYDDFAYWFCLDPTRIFSKDCTYSKILGESLGQFEEENEFSAYEHLYQEGFFLLTLESDGDVAFCLTQADPSKKPEYESKRNDLFSVGYSILKFDSEVDHIPTAYEKGEYEEIHDSGDILDYRDLAHEASNLEPGNYAIIPRFDYAGCEYSMRIFTNASSYQFEYYYPEEKPEPEEDDEEGGEEEEGADEEEEGDDE